MPDTRHVTVTLGEEQIAALEAAVEAGEYATTSDVVRAAVHEWQLERELHEEDVGEDVGQLRRLWDEGKASGPAQPFDVERTIATGKARLGLSGVVA